MTRREFAKKSAMYLAAAATTPTLGFPSIITRSKRLLTKPVGPLSLNFGHPLALGMTVCYTFNSPGGQGAGDGLDIDADLVQNLGAGDWNTTNWAWIYGPPGSGVRITNTNTRLQLGGNLTELQDRVPTKNCTILFVRRKTDTTLRNSIHWGANAGAAGETDRCDASIPIASGDVFFDWGGVTAPNRLTISGLSFAATVEHWAFRAGDWGSAVWRDGVKVGSQSTALTRVPASGANSEFYLNGITATIGDLQEIYFFAIANQQWTDDMVNWWMAEPYAMLMPQSPKIRYFLMPGVGGKKIRVFVNT